MAGNYSETDISFFGQEMIRDFEVIPHEKGFFIQWEKSEEVGGHSIYRKPMGTEGWELVVTLEDGITSYLDSKPPIDLPYDYRLYRIIEGDFMLGEADNAGGVDFKITTGHESGAQDVTNRLRTQKGDWRSHPNLGANLELLEGEPNTRETGERGVEQIKDALTYDSRFSDSDVTVRAVPTSVEQIDFYAIIDSDDREPIVVKDTLNL